MIQYATPTEDEIARDLVIAFALRIAPGRVVGDLREQERTAREILRDWLERVGSGRVIGVGVTP